MNRLFVFALLVVLAAPAFAQDGKPDAEGFIRDWLFLGPFPITEGGATDIEKSQIKDEGALKPSAGDKQKVDDKELAWKAIKATDYFFDLNKILDSANSDVLGYLVTYVVADADMAGLKLGIGSNDQARIYVNGKEVFKFTETRTVDKDSDKVDKIDLKKGVNVIVFKLINEQNDWQGALRFLDKDDKPVTTLKVQTKP
jgi:hypothetical protein